jgi:hypothetical protein
MPDWAGGSGVPAGRMTGGKPVEYVVPVRLALGALRFIADDPVLSERFLRDALTGNPDPELLTQELLKDSAALFAEAMLLEGYT